MKREFEAVPSTVQAGALVKIEPIARLRLGERLIARGVLTKEQLEIALDQQALMARRGKQVLLGKLLIQNRFCSQDDIADAEDGEGKTGHTVRFHAMLLSSADCLRFKVEPISVTGNELMVRAAHAIDEPERARIAAACRVKVSMVRVQLVGRNEMHAFLSSQVHRESFAVLVESLSNGEPGDVQLRAAIDAMLREAIDGGASDIHLDNYPDPYAFVAMRYDGRLKYRAPMPSSLMAAFFSRIKTLANLDASDARHPQDGSLLIEHAGRTVNVRVATRSSKNGEIMTMRVLDPAALQTIESLYPNQPHMQKLVKGYSKMKGKRGGLVMVVGSTGSGKSSTLNVYVADLPRHEVNVLTIEDPVEYVMPLTRQVERQHFFKDPIERSFLRQDPDIIVYGEVRDAQDAQAAVSFADSGHLVFVTLHARNERQAVERLLNMIPAENRSEAGLVVADTLMTVSSQQLVPRLCKCAVPIENDRDIRQAQGVLHDALAGQSSQRAVPSRIYKPVGCVECENRGYRGRVVLHGTMVFNLLEQARVKLAQHLSSKGTLAGCDVEIHRYSLARTACDLLESGDIDVGTAASSIMHSAILSAQDIAHGELAEAGFEVA